MGRFIDLMGTTTDLLRIGIGATAVSVKQVAGKLRVRNKADSADAIMVGSVIAASGDFLELNEDAAGAGADWKLTLARPAAGMAAARTITFPAEAPTAGFALVTDGAGNLSYAAMAAGNDKAITDTTTLAFGSAASTALFTAPIGAVIQGVSIVVDTAFTGTPSLSIGIAASVSKYVGATQVDLTQVASTVFDVSPGLPAAGVAEALIATYAAGAATAGSARILVTFSIPS